MRKKQSKHLIEKLLDQEKHRLHVALATEEGEWNQHEPNSGMARMFVVMLLLHVILIGGIVIYDILDDEGASEAPQVALTATPEASSGTDLSNPEVEKSDSVAPAPIEPPANAEDYEKYVVKSGDTLPGIAKHLNVDEKALVSLNRIDKGAEFDAQTTLLVPKEKLPESAKNESAVPTAIPVDRELFEPKTAMTSTGVESGTPAEAKEVGPSAVASAVTETEATNITDTQDAPPAASVETEAPKAIPMPDLEATKTAAIEPTPAVEDEKPVASAPAPEPAPVAKPEPKPAPASTKTHTLEPGETLYRLSILYGVSVDALQKANNITDPGKLQIGQRLVIPAQ